MNFFQRITSTISTFSKTIKTPLSEGTIGSFSRIIQTPLSQVLVCYGNSLERMHRVGPIRKYRPSKNPLEGRPQCKGVVLKTLIKKPKKPNSANRKCVLVRLSFGKEMVAYVPGIGHNLQEHNVVLVEPHRLRDTPGVKLRCIRGVYDLPHVIKVAKK